MYIKKQLQIKQRIARIALESEMENKHYEKKKSKNEISNISNQLKQILDLIFFKALLHQIILLLKAEQLFLPNVTNRNVLNSEIIKTDS